MRVVPRVVIVSASEIPAGFNREHRLHQPKEFAAVISASKAFRGNSFDLLFLETRTQKQARLGLIVPKRLARAASLRNAIKRQGREAFRLSLARFADCDLVLRLKRPANQAKPQLRQQLRLWRGEIEALFDRLANRNT